MTSLRRQLTVRVLVATLALSAAAGAAVYAHAHRLLLEQFDAEILGKARVFAALLEVNPAGELVVELNDASLPEYFQAKPDRFFELRHRDGSIAARSPALGSERLVPRDLRVREGRGFEVDLPDGRPGRGVVVRFAPWLRPADPTLPDLRPKPKPDEFTLTLVRDRSALNGMLNLLLSSVLLTGAGLACGSGLAVSVLVRRGVRPVAEVAEQAALIDAASLERRIPMAGLPQELRPIGNCINELMDRVQAGFNRERQFTSNVAHELRTPIAELRALSEVALQPAASAIAKGLSAAASEQYYRDALEISLQMESIVKSLLALTRCQSGTLAMTRTAVDVGELVANCWRRHAPAATVRNLRVELGVDEGAVVVETDRALLASIVDNLLANATEYAPIGSAVSCRLRHDVAATTLTIANTNANLNLDDLTHMREPFWRKDAARSDSSHAGLGLAVVDAYVKLLGIAIELDLAPSGDFVVTLTLEASTTVGTDSRVLASARRVPEPLAAH